MSTEQECRDTYVTTCNPEYPPMFLPDCEDGWEIGNGEAVCATQQPTSAPLATTGADAGMFVGFGLLAALLLGLGAVMASRLRQRK
ncbi:hypothetical protein SEA_JEMERALD_43 [Microbacterium phage Jemerald]|nr:membrane protein [Microbacterium phage Juicer]WNO27282.1 hypothetical protein SEA_JEMERALD_43 [Microbacterium phage Jemerald]